MKIDLPLTLDLTEWENTFNIILIVLGCILFLSLLSCVCRLVGWMEWIYKGLCCYCRRPKTVNKEERSNLLRQEV